MNDEHEAGRPASPGPDPRIGDSLARRLLELGLMQENRFTPGGDVPTPEELNELLPEYEIEGLIGKGGMGAVFRARQKSLDRVVALKVLIEPEADAGFAERFQREAQTLASLSHPGIVAVHDFGRAGDHWYLSMELVEGTDLRRVIDGRAITPREALEIVSQVCEALQFAHDKGVVHRDIKPGNVLLDVQGQVKITDFGLAKMLGVRPAPALTRATQVMGTPNYMAPEQWETPLEVDHRADIYSLGVVLYELLTGELPMGNFALPSQRVQVDVRLDDVVLRALQKELPRRYQSAADVRTDVQHVVAHPEQQRVGSRRDGALVLGWVAAAGFALLALLFASGWIPGRASSTTGGSSARAASPASSSVEVVKMRDLLVEEDGRFVAKTIEFDAQGVPSISAHFAEVFDMDEGEVALADDFLRTQRQAYVALETSRTMAQWSPRTDKVILRIDDFGDEGSELVANTMALLEGTLGGRQVPDAARQEILRALFPLVRGGRGELTMVGDEPTLEISAGGGGTREVRGDRIEREFGNLLAGLAQPPTSALPATMALIRSLEAFDWGPLRTELSQCNGQELWETETGSDSLDVRYLFERDPVPCSVMVEMVLTRPPVDGESDQRDPAGRTTRALSDLDGELQPRLTAYLRGQTGYEIDRVRLSEQDYGMSLMVFARSVGTPGSLLDSDKDLEATSVAQELTAAVRAAGFEGEFEGLYDHEVAPHFFSQMETDFEYIGEAAGLRVKDFLRCLAQALPGDEAGTISEFRVRPYRTRRANSPGMKADVVVLQRKAWPRPR
ncbi:MAG: serine/threonine-protein kinase [Planctomycetota bacterium]|nr:serine/threonine-protein kinase [Planctomycetota bacterium]